MKEVDVGEHGEASFHDGFGASADDFATAKDERGGGRVGQTKGDGGKALRVVFGHVETADDLW